MKTLWINNEALINILSEQGIELISNENMDIVVSDEDAERIPAIVEKYAPTAVYDYGFEEDESFVFSEEEEEKEIPHKEKVTDVNFKSITGHDICIRVKRVSEIGYDVSFVEMSIDGGAFYKNISSSKHEGQVHFRTYDKEQDKTLQVIIPDDVYCNIMFLRGEELFHRGGYFDDILLAKVKEYIAKGWVLSKAELKKGMAEADMKSEFFFYYRDESEMNILEVLDYLQGTYAKGLNGNYRGYMIAEYVEVIKKLYPNEF